MTPAHMREIASTRWFARVFFLAASSVLLAVLVYHSRKFFPFFVDDALISLQYVKRFVAGQGLTWTEGPAVEGYSNLLWILLLSIPGALGIDLMLAARILGFVATALLPLLLLFRRGIDNPLAMLPAFLVLLLFPLSSIMALWAIGGLEQPLFALLLLLVILALFRQFDVAEYRPRLIRFAAVMLGLTALTRPDGMLFAVLAAMTVLILRWRGRPDLPLRAAGTLLVIPSLSVVGQTAFRLLYYHDWIPNPARIKIAFTADRVRTGMEYLRGGITPEWVFWTVAAFSLLAVVSMKRSRAHGLLLASFLAGWGVYVLLIGGDHFTGLRHFIPLYLFAIAGMVELIRAVAAGANPRRRAAVLIVYGTAIAFLLPQYYVAQRQHYGYPFAESHHWVWDGEVLGRLFHEVYGRQKPLIGVTAAGCYPYWSELPAIDMLGLNDRYIAMHPTRAVGNGWVGHEAGNGAYVLSRKPDLIVFTAGNPEPQFQYEVDFAPGTPFRTQYVPVWMQGSDPFVFAGTVWMRRESPRIGMRRDGGALVIPGVFFAGSEANAARLNDGRTLETPLRAGDTLRCTLPGAIPADARITIRGTHADEIRSVVRGKLLLLTTPAVGAAIEEVRIEQRETP